MRELTGRTRILVRYRRWRRPLLVAQVQERFSEMALISGWPDRISDVHWRDMRADDLPHLNVSWCCGAAHQ